MNAPSLKESLERWTLPPKLPPTFRSAENTESNLGSSEDAW